MPEQKIPMTPKGAQRLKDELKQRKEVTRYKIVKAIEEARGHGDLSENADYSAAKEAQSFNEGRIKELEGTLALSNVIDPATLSGTKVVFGATVKLADADSGEEVVYSIVGESEADIKKGLISITAPLARSMIGRESGDTVQVRTPKGGQREYEILKVEFREIPGTAPVWNTGGIIFWQAAHFTNPATQDVLVTVRRSMMHSDETALLSGKDGAQLWRRNRQVGQRGVGGTPFAIADFDGDGLDDAASFYPSIFYILKGATGADIIAKDATWDSVPAKPVYWGKPVAGHFLKHDGPAEVFMAGASMAGLVRADASLVWSDALEKSAKTFAFGDFDGSGTMQAIGAEFEDGFRCYDAATGAIKWRMPNTMTGALAGAASADIDSDGKDEAVFASGTTLYCLGAKDGHGILKWTLPLSSTTGPPALAAAEGNGNLSIILLGANGCVYCVR